MLKTPLVIITAAPKQPRPCPLHQPVLHQSCPELTFSLISLIRGISQRREGVREERGGFTGDEQRKWKRWMGESPLRVRTFHLILLIFNSCLSKLPLRPAPHHQPPPPIPPAPTRSYAGIMMDYQLTPWYWQWNHMGAWTADMSNMIEFLQVSISEKCRLILTWRWCLLMSWQFNLFWSVVEGEAVQIKKNSKLKQLCAGLQERS